MTIATYVEGLSKHGISLWAEDGRLRYRASNAAVTEELLRELKARKQEILRYLESDGRAAVERHDLSLGQLSMWSICQQAAGLPLYVISLAAWLQESANLRALQAAVDHLGRRHEMLRTTFAADNGKPVQRIHPDRRLQLRTVAADGWDDRRCEQWIQRELDRPLKLEAGVAEFTVLSRTAAAPEGARHLLLVRIHHIAADYWSFDLLMNELTELHEAARNRTPVALPRSKFGYLDHIRDEQALLSDARGQALRRYWREKLSPFPPVLDLPLDRPRPPSLTFNGAILATALDDETGRRIRELAKRHAVTPFVLFLALFNLLLHRFCRQQEIVLGLATAGRDDERTHQLVGHFVNTVVLRLPIDAKESFSRFMKRVQAAVFEALKHEALPFPALIEHLNPPRLPNMSPLFQVLFNWNQVQGDIDERRHGKVRRLIKDILRSSNSNGALTTHDLALTVTDIGSRFILTWNYNTDLFDAASIERMDAHLRHLLSRVLADAESLCRAEIMSPEDRAAVLQAAGGRERPNASAGGLHRRFEARAKAAPDETALTFNGRSWSNARLDAAADALAGRVLQHGIGRGAVVATLLPLSDALIVARLATLKAGAAHLAIDPTWPVTRVAALLEQVTPSLILCRVAAETARRFASAGACADLFLGIEDDPAPPPVAALDDVASEIGPTDLACIACIWEGDHAAAIALTHDNLAVALDGLAAIGREDDRRCVLAGSPLGSVAALTDWLLPLCHGGRLVIADDLQGLDALDPPVSMVSAPPSLAERLFDAPRLLARLRVLNLVGSPTGFAAAQSYHAAGVDRVFATYGSPAAGGVCAAALLPRGHAGKLPIGRPFNNARIYLLDNSLEPVPAGVAGEICIAGAGIGRALAADADGLAGKFAANPHGDGAFARLFRSGELGRQKTDGNIEYLGRIDVQPRLHGLRLDLPAIEAALSDAAGGCPAAALASPDGGAPVLTAFLAPRGDDHPDARLLRSQLEKSFPSAVLPHRFVFLERMPYRPDGTIDRGALDLSDAAGMAESAEDESEPRTDLEALVLRVWLEILDADRIGIFDNFFECGGDSIAVLKIVSKLRDLGYEVTPRTLLEYQTVAELAAALVATAAPRKAPAALPGRREADAALRTAWAKRLGIVPEEIESVAGLATLQQFFLDDLGSSPRSSIPRMVVQYRADLPALDIDAFHAAWRQVVARHGALRTLFVADGETKLQLVLARVTLDWIEEDWSGRAAAEVDRQFEELIARDRANGFAFAQAPLMRWRLVRLSGGGWRLLWSFHHALLDGWSTALLLREVLAFYDAARRATSLSLPEAPQFQTYLTWLDGCSATRRDTDESFWRRYLRGLRHFTELPLADPCTTARSENRLPASLNAVLITESELGTIEEFARKAKVTLNILLQAAWGLLLWRCHGGPDALFATVVSGRPTEIDGVERIIGSFFQVLPVRIPIPQEGTVFDWLTELHRRQEECNDHQFASPALIQEWSELPKDRHYSDQTILVFQNYAEAGWSEDSLDLAAWRHMQPGASKLHVSVAPDGRSLSVLVRYDASSYPAATVSRLVAAFAANIKALCGAGDGAVAERLAPLERLSL